VVDEYLADEIDPTGPWTDADVLECALAHSTRVAAAHAGWSISRVRALRARHGHNRGRGHPSAAELEREAPRITCPCRRCAAWRSGEATRSSIRHARTQPKGFPGPGPWVHEAACGDRDAGTAVFFPRVGDREADPDDSTQARQRGVTAYKPERYEHAKAICRRCPSIEPCRAYALANHLRFGVWGGLDWLERDRLLGYLPIEAA
jgi:hypothetical protein